MCARHNENVNVDINLQASSTSESEKQRDYLSNRLDDICNTKHSELAEKYFVTSPLPPKTFEDLLERLTTGKFTIEEKARTKKDYYGCGLSFVDWRTQPADEEGFKKAAKDLYAMRTKTMDNISILDPKDGLKALEKFEGTTFH